MHTDFLNQTVIMVVAIVFMVLGVLYQVAIGVMFGRMIQASDTMTGADNKLMKQCKERFIQCYNLNGGVANVAVFVDKFINRIHFMGMSLNFIKHLSGQLMLAGVFIAGFGVCKGIVSGTRFIELIPFYIVSLFGIYVYVSVASMVDIQGRKQMLKTNLVDYLENHVSQRLENGMKINEKSKLLEGITRQKQNDRNEKDMVGKKGQDTFTRDDAKELEELLKSFMV